MVTSPVAPSKIAVGDIIVFRPPSVTTTVAHRVVDVELAEDTVLFKTKGDAANNYDSDVVPVTNLLGKVICWIPFVGRIVHSIRSVPGFGLIMLVTTILLLLVQVRSLIRIRSSKPSKHLSSIE